MLARGARAGVAMDCAIVSDRTAPVKGDYYYVVPILISQKCDISISTRRTSMFVLSYAYVAVILTCFSGVCASAYVLCLCPSD